MDLTISTHQYLKYVLPTLVLESDSNLLFPRLSGDAHDHQSFRSNWLRIQAEYQAPWQPFPPQCTRHIYAGFRIEELAQQVANLPPGQGTQGDAQIQGNSHRVMAGAYAMRANDSYAEAAISRIAAWRHAAWAAIQAEPSTA